MGCATGMRLDTVQVAAEAAFAQDIPGMPFQFDIPTLPSAA
ncbi:hypothetical protein C5F59_038080 [Streptomyces sp. QL37]|nr:hypothetical protein [Streptomyces sp. QL37]